MIDEKYQEVYNDYEKQIVLRRESLEKVIEILDKLPKEDKIRVFACAAEDNGISNEVAHYWDD